MSDLLDKLDLSAESRIADVPLAKSLLLALARSLGDDSLLLQDLALRRRIVIRTTYFLNARDSTVRVAAIVASRRAVGVDAGLAQLFLSTKSLLGLVRCLERDSHLHWERCQGLKFARLLMRVAPEAVPMALIRSLVAVAGCSGAATAFDSPVQAGAGPPGALSNQQQSALKSQAATNASTAAVLAAYAAGIAAARAEVENIDSDAGALSAQFMTNRISPRSSSQRSSSNDPKRHRSGTERSKVEEEEEGSRRNARSDNDQLNDVVIEREDDAFEVGKRPFHALDGMAAAAMLSADDSNDVLSSAGTENKEITQSSTHQRKKRNNLEDSGSVASESSDGTRNNTKGFASGNTSVADSGGGGGTVNPSSRTQRSGSVNGRQRSSSASKQKKIGDQGNSTSAARSAAAIAAGTARSATAAALAAAAAAVLPAHSSSSILMLTQPSADSLRRSALETLRIAALIPKLLPLIAASGGITLLIDSLIEFAASSVPGDSEFAAGPVLFTLLRIASDPRTRSFCPPSNILLILSSVWTSGEGLLLTPPIALGVNTAFAAPIQTINALPLQNQTPISNSQRARWSAARHLLVSLSRTWTGLFALSSDPHCLPSLLGLLLHARHSPQLMLSVMRTILELLTPPSCAASEGLQSLVRLGPRLRIPLIMGGMSATTHSSDAEPSSFYDTNNSGPPRDHPEVFLQSLSIAFSAERCRLNARGWNTVTLAAGVAAAATAAGLAAAGAPAGADAGAGASAEDLMSLDDETVLSVASSTDLDAPGGAAIATLVSSALDAGFNHSSNIDASLNVSSLRWSRTVATSLSEGAKSSSGLALPYWMDESLHGVDDEPEFSAPFWLDIGRAAPKHACFRNKKQNSSLHTPFVAVDELVQQYRAYLLQALVDGGLFRALLSASSHVSPIVSLAAIELRRYAVRLSKVLLPSLLQKSSAGTHGMDFQLSLMASSRATLSAPHPDALFSPSETVDCTAARTSTRNSYSRIAAGFGLGLELRDGSNNRPFAQSGSSGAQLLRGGWKGANSASLRAAGATVQCEMAAVRRRAYLSFVYRACGLKSDQVSGLNDFFQKQSIDEKLKDESELEDENDEIQKAEGDVNNDRQKSLSSREQFQGPFLASLLIDDPTIRSAENRDALHGIALSGEVIPSVSQSVSHLEQTSAFDFRLEKYASSHFPNLSRVADTSLRPRFSLDRDPNNVTTAQLQRMVSSETAKDRVEVLLRSQESDVDSAILQNELLLAAEHIGSPLSKSTFASWHAELHARALRRAELDNLRANGVLPADSDDPDDNALVVSGALVDKRKRVRKFTLNEARMNQTDNDDEEEDGYLIETNNRLPSTLNDGNILLPMYGHLGHSNAWGSRLNILREASDGLRSSIGLVENGTRIGLLTSTSAAEMRRSDFKSLNSEVSYAHSDIYSVDKLTETLLMSAVRESSLHSKTILERPATFTGELGSSLALPPSGLLGAMLLSMRLTQGPYARFRDLDEHRGNTIEALLELVVSAPLAGTSFDESPYRQKESTNPPVAISGVKHPSFGLLSKPIGSIAYIREEDRAIEWEIVRYNRGGLSALIRAEERADMLQKSSSPWSIHFASLVRAYHSLPTHARLLYQDGHCETASIHSRTIENKTTSSTSLFKIPPSIFLVADFLGPASMHPHFPLSVQHSAYSLGKQALTMKNIPSITAASLGGDLSRRLAAYQGVVDASTLPQARPHARPFISELLRRSVQTNQAFHEKSNSASKTSGVAEAGAANVSVGDPPLDVSSKVSNALKCVALSRVCSLPLSEWRQWDWTAVSILLDYYLIDETILSAVETQTHVLQKLGEAFTLSLTPVTGTSGVVGASASSPVAALTDMNSGGVFGIPWTPAALRFVCIVRQWMILLIEHPSVVINSILLHQGSNNGNESRSLSSSSSTAVLNGHSGGGFLGEVLLALYSQISPRFQIILRSCGTRGSTTPSSGAASQQNTTSLAAEDLVAKDLIRSLISTIQSGAGGYLDGIAYSLSRRSLELSLARELIPLVYGCLLSCPRGWALISSNSLVRAASIALFRLSDSPDGRTLVRLLQDFGVSDVEMKDMDAILGEPLLPLILLGSDLRPDLEPLARCLIQSLSCFIEPQDGARDTLPLKTGKLKAQAEQTRLILRSWTVRVRTRVEPTINTIATKPRAIDNVKQIVNKEKEKSSMKKRKDDEEDEDEEEEEEEEEDEEDEEDEEEDDEEEEDEEEEEDDDEEEEEEESISDDDASVPNKEESPIEPFYVRESLALFVTSHLRALLRRGEPGFNDWGVSLLVEIINGYRGGRSKSSPSLGPSGCETPRAVAENALSILTECAHTHRALRLSILLCRPLLFAFEEDLVEPLVTALLSEGAAGIAYVKEQGQLFEHLLEKWMKIGIVSYAAELDAVLGSALSSTVAGGVAIDGGRFGLAGVAKALLPVCSISSDGGRSSNSEKEARTVPLPIRVPLIPAAQQDLFSSSASSDGLFTGDVGSVTHLPWRVLVWAEWTSNVSTADKTATNTQGSSEKSSEKRQSLSRTRTAGSDASSSAVVMSSSSSLDDDDEDNSASATAKKLQVRRARMDIPVDTVFDLSKMRPEPTSASKVRNSSLFSCDGIIKATCLNPETGAPCAFALPADATLHAAIFVGAQALSQLGDIPFVADLQTTNDKRSTIGENGALYQSYADPTSIVATLALCSASSSVRKELSQGVAAGYSVPSSRLINPSSKDMGTAPTAESSERTSVGRERGMSLSATALESSIATSRGNQTARGRSVSFGGTSGVNGKRHSSGSDSLEQAADDALKRNSTTTASTTEKKIQSLPLSQNRDRAHTKSWSSGIALPSLLYSSSSASSRSNNSSVANNQSAINDRNSSDASQRTATLSPHLFDNPRSGLDDASARLRERNETAVTSLASSLPFSQNDVFLESSLSSSTRQWASDTGLLNYSSSATSNSSSTHSGLLTKEKRFLATTTRSTAQVAAMLRSSSNRNAEWSEGRVDSVDRVAAESSDKKEGETMKELVLCPPGSAVRFVFSAPGSPFSISGNGLSLLRVEVDISLIPRTSNTPNLRIHLFASLATSDNGVKELENAGCISSLIEATFGREASLEGRKDAIRAMLKKKKRVANTNEFEPNEKGQRLSRRRASLWGLASICAASNKGLEAVISVCPDFFLRLDAAARGLKLRFVPGQAALLKGSLDIAIESGGLDAVPEIDEDVSFRASVLSSLNLFSRQKDGASILGLLGWALSPSQGGILPVIPATAMSLIEETIASSRMDDEAESLVVPFLHSSRRPSVDDIALGLGSEGAKAVKVLVAGLQELGSRVHIKEARLSLLKLRSEYPMLFSNSGAFLLAHSIAARQALSLGARRFITFLFREVSFHERNW